MNRSFTKVLQRLFSFAKAEGAMFEREPKWDELLLPEPVERVRELQEDEATAFDDAMRVDYAPFFDFIRTSGMFDGVADFAAVTEDPANPGHLRPAYDTNSTVGGPGDHLHPNRAGFLAMGAAVDVAQVLRFVRAAAGKRAA